MILGVFPALLVVLLVQTWVEGAPAPLTEASLPPMKIPVYLFRATQELSEECSQDPTCPLLKRMRETASDSAGRSRLRQSILASLLAKTSLQELVDLREPDFFRKARFLKALSDTGFAATLVNGSLPDSTKLALGHLRRQSLRLFSAWAPLGDGRDGEPAGEPATRITIGPGSDALASLFMNYQEIAYLGITGRNLPLLGSVLGNPGVSDAFDVHEVEKLLARLPVSARTAMWAKPLPSFKHKLLLALKDAVWMGASTHSDIFARLGGMHVKVSPVDSQIILTYIQDFGRRHAGLAYRINRKDRSTWMNPKLARLDSASDSAVHDLLANRISRSLAASLSQFVADTLRFQLPLDQYPDFLAVSSAANRLEILLRSTGVSALEADFLDRLRLPGLPTDYFRKSTSLQIVPLRGRKEIRKLLKSDPVALNLIRLVVARQEMYKYFGSTQRLYSLVRDETDI